MPQRRTTALLALPLAALLLVPAATAATASTSSGTDGDVTVVNTETVQARLDATGRLREARLYEQLSFTGTGTAEVVNPTSTAGLRNLDAFGGFTAGDGVMRTRVDVDGEKRLRTVSDYSGDLPVSVEVTYLLDGEPVTPRGVVGRSGTLEVRYTVTNLTVRQDEVTYDDGTGGRATATAETVVPMVGQLTTVLPPSFTAVASDEASIAGDGRGGTRLSFTMTLFPPIGSPTAEFGWTATIRDGQVPPANVSVLPVNPLASPSFKGGAASYQGGAESGIALTSGATQIDENLLRLHDGAVTLLDGLRQLEAGAQELATGLNGTAVPGAAQLADGADELDRGARRLSAGVAQLDAGAGELANGATQLAGGLHEAGSKAPALLGGLQEVQAGLAKVDDGLAQLYGGVDQLPAKAGALHDGVADLRAGVDQLQAGAANLRSTLANLAAVLQALAGTDATVTRALPGNHERLLGLAGFVSGVAATQTNPAKKATLEGLAALYADDAVPVVPLGPGLEILATVLAEGAVPGVWRLQCGLGGLDEATTTAVCGGETGLAGGLQRFDAGIDLFMSEVVTGLRAAIGVEGHTKEDGTLRGGVASLEAGTGEILTGARTLLDGLGRLMEGADALSAGAGRLDAGTSELDAGVGALTAGTDRLAAGSARLSAGLRDAGDGSARLSEGLTQAAEGAPALADGAKQLSEEGTSVLAETGASTAADYGVKFAVIEAGAQRAVEEGMAFGTPEGAHGMTAWSLDIAGVDGSGTRTMGRGIAAAALFGLAALAVPLRRRLL